LQRLSRFRLPGFYFISCGYSFPQIFDLRANQF
jgi:hypothetical protein